VEANNPIPGGGGSGTGNGPVSPSISFWFRLNRIILRLCSTHQFKNLQVSYLRPGLSEKSYAKQVPTAPQTPPFFETFSPALLLSLLNFFHSTWQNIFVKMYIKIIDFNV